MKLIGKCRSKTEAGHPNHMARKVRSVFASPNSPIFSCWTIYPDQLPHMVEHCARLWPVSERSHGREMVRKVFNEIGFTVVPQKGVGK